MKKDLELLALQINSLQQKYMSATQLNRNLVLDNQALKLCNQQLRQSSQQNQVTIRQLREKQNSIQHEKESLRQQIEQCQSQLRERPSLSEVLQWQTEKQGLRIQNKRLSQQIQFLRAQNNQIKRRLQQPEELKILDSTLSQAFVHSRVKTKSNRPQKSKKIVSSNKKQVPAVKKQVNLQLQRRYERLLGRQEGQLMFRNKLQKLLNIKQFCNYLWTNHFPKRQARPWGRLRRVALSIIFVIRLLKKGCPKGIQLIPPRSFARSGRIKSLRA